MSDPGPDDDQAASLAGLTTVRDVLQLRRALPVEPAVAASAPAVGVRAFRPGTDDEAAWIACNNRSFAAHPDQAGFTVKRLHETMAEPWFDPSGFLLHEDHGRMVGFCWTKVHADTDPPLGEIYVIGVDPDVAGRGLGRSLTLAGLDSLAGRGIGVGMLYVDASNTAARRLYQRLGFALHHVDRVYDSPSPGVSDLSGDAGRDLSGSTGRVADRSGHAGADHPAHGERDAGGEGGDPELPRR